MKLREKKIGQKVDPADLEVIKTTSGFALALDGEILLTNEGASIQHEAEPLLAHIASEFDGHGTMRVQERRVVSPKFFGSYALFSIQKAWVERGKDDLSLGFADRLLKDPVLHPLTGPEEAGRIARSAPLSMWLGDRFKQLREAASHLGYWRGESDSGGEDLTLARESVSVTALRAQYLALPPEERATVMMLHAIHRDHVLFPLALVMRKCSEPEYAMGVLAGHAVLTGSIRDVSDKAQSKAFEELRADAGTALDYIRFYRKETQSQMVREMVAVGETATQEFKSTLRWNQRAGMNDDQITHACIKTIAAFLNTEGGRLLIGVSDNGTIVGIEKDGFGNLDKFQLHLLDVLKQSLGKTVATAVRLEILPAAGLSICVVTCPKSDMPVYCKPKNGDELFYVRAGPSTIHLPLRETASYVAKHFRNIALH